jgi:hypothetical protein
MMVSIENISGTNTGASTLNVNGLGALPITGPAGAALQGGEMAVGYGAFLRLNHAGTAYTLIATTGGSMPVKAATASNQAVNLGQLETLGTVTNGAVGYSASTTLTAANQGQIVFYTSAATAAGTFTLPAANALPAYQCKIVISNQSSYPLTIAVPSGDSTDLNPTVLQPNQYCCVVNDGNTNWHTLWNTVNNTEFVTLSELQNGSISPTFGPTVVSPATASNQAVTYSQLGNLNGVIAPITSNTTLPNTAYGQAIQVGNGVTVTLPTSNGNAGDLLYFFGGSGSYSITNNPGQFIFASALGMTATSGTTTLTVQNGGTALLMSRDNGEFDVIGGSVIGTAVNLNNLFIGNRKAIFTSNGTYTVPSGVTQIWVSGCAGGGGGGGAASGITGGNGGSAGQSVIRTPFSVSPGDSLSITVGAGGAAGASSSASGTNAGGSGGNSTVVDTTASITLLTLNGGSGGHSGGNNNYNGGSYYNTANSQGYPPGGNGCMLYYGGFYFSMGGAGASSLFGVGGCGAYGVGQGASQNAYGYGAGGGGACSDAGGHGAPGMILIEW